jgi:hypothetical protein
MEVSAKENIRVNEAFIMLASMIKEDIENEDQSEEEDKIDTKVPQVEEINELIFFNII